MKKGKKLKKMTIDKLAIFVAIGFLFSTNIVSADCSITNTLRLGSKGIQVACLQTNLNLTPDGNFGPQTKSAVIVFQKANGLTVDGILGPKTIAALLSTPSPALATTQEGNNTSVSDATLVSAIQKVINTPEYQNKLRGPQGFSGSSGGGGTIPVYTASSPQTNSVAIIPSGIAMPDPAHNFSGASYFSATNLSSNLLTTGTANLGDLNVSGSSTLKDLNVTGTITGNVAGIINPNLTLGSIAFQGASGLTQDNTNLFWDSTNHRIGIGTTGPQAALHIVGNDSTLGFVMDDMYSDVSNPGFFGRRARGTVNSPGALLMDDAIVSLGGRGYGTTGFSGTRARLTFWAAENWTDTAQGAYVTLVTTPIGTAVAQERLRVTDSGNVGIGTISPDRLLHAELADTATNAVSYINRLSHITSGTAAAGFGAGSETELQNAAGTNRVASTIDTSWATATNAAETADWTLKLMSGGALTQAAKIAAGNVFMGMSAGISDTSFGSNGVGYLALQSNTGIFSNGFGFSALLQNTGEAANGFGDSALVYNSGAYVSGIGSGVLYVNNGAHAIGVGHHALFYNNWPDVIGIGRQTNLFYFPDDPATTKNITEANITATGTITYVAHGFGTVGGKVNLRYKLTGGTAPTGLVDNTVYQFTVTSANVLTLVGIEATPAAFTGTLTNSVDITNSIAIGSFANATKANQVMLGASTITETILRGNVGIGTTAPTANLQVAQGTAGTGTVAVSGTAVTGVGTQFTNTFKVGDTITVTTTSGSETKAIATITSDTVLVTAAFTGTASAGTAYTLVGGTRFSVLGNGNVGIGTTAPGSTLHVNGGMQVGTAPTGGDKGSGSINISGDIYKNNTAYTNPDYVFEKYFTGNIVKFANNPGASTYAGLKPITEVAQFAKDQNELPLIANGQGGLFGKGDSLLASLEESYLYLFDHENRITGLNLNLEGVAGTVTPTAGSANETFVTAFFTNIKNKTSAWLSDAGNGITNIFAGTITVHNANVDNLCIKKSNGTDVCITGDQLDSLLTGAGESVTNNTGGSSGSNNSPTPTCSDGIKNQDETGIDTGGVCTPNTPAIATLESIAITTSATKLSYTVGDTLDITGLVVTGTYSDTTTKIETITATDVSGFDNSKSITGQILTITVGGKTTTYTINVVEATVQ